MPRVILTPWRGGSQDKNQAPGQDNGLIGRWESGQKSEEEQDGQAERDKKNIKWRKGHKRDCNLGTGEIWHKNKNAFSG